MLRTDHDITEMMIRYGGGFVAGLGRLYRCADPDNQKRLQHAFPEYWTFYRQFAQQEPPRPEGSTPMLTPQKENL